MVGKYLCFKVTISMLYELYQTLEHKVTFTV